MTTSAGRDRYDAVVLAGGAGRRLGGVDKPGQLVGGATLLDRVLDAVADAERTVVVGPPRSTAREVRWVFEEPPGSGPVPALAAGLAAVSAPAVVVLAADLPFLSPACVRRLLDCVGNAAGAVAVDDNGAEQWLLGCWRTKTLRTAVSAGLRGDGGAVSAGLRGGGGAVSAGLRGGGGAVSAGLRGGGSPSLRSVLAPLVPVGVRLDAGGGPPPWYDCDTPQELSQAGEWTEAVR